jgi:membrane protein involved in colicin uptake
MSDNSKPVVATKKINGEIAPGTIICPADLGLDIAELRALDAVTDCSEADLAVYEAQKKGSKAGRGSAAKKAEAEAEAEAKAKAEAEAEAEAKAKAEAEAEAKAKAEAEAEAEAKAKAEAEAEAKAKAGEGLVG